MIRIVLNLGVAAIFACSLCDFAALAEQRMMPNFPLNSQDDISSKSVRPAGASVQRSLEDRFSDDVNAKDYGAKCDYDPAKKSGTDDTLALQAAIDKAQTSTAQGGGRRLLLPGGNCLTGSLAISGQIDMMGAGSHSTTLHLKADSNKALITFEASGADFTNKYGYPQGNVRLSHFRLTSQGGHNGSPSAHGLELKRSQSGSFTPWIRIDDIVIYNLPGSGIFSGPFDGFLEATRSTFSNNGGWGTETNSTVDWRFIECEWSVNTKGNLLSSGDNQMFLLNPNIYAATAGYGVVAYQTDLKIIGGSIDHNAKGGIQFKADSTPLGRRVLLSGGTALGSNSRSGKNLHADIEIHGNGTALTLQNVKFAAKPNKLDAQSFISHNIKFMDVGQLIVDIRDTLFLAGSVLAENVVSDRNRISAIGQQNGSILAVGGIIAAGPLQQMPLSLNRAPSTKEINPGYCVIIRRSDDKSLRISCNEDGIIRSSNPFQ